MRKLFIIYALLLAFSLVSYGQTAESDRLFAKGVELYNQGKYTDAIPLFSKSNSIDKETLADNIYRRDYSELWLASCWHKLGKDEKAKSFSRYYMAKPIDRRLTVRSDSLAAISGAYKSNGNYTEALKYQSQCIMAEKEELGVNNIWVANSLVNTADLVFMCTRDTVGQIQTLLQGALAVYMNEGYNVGIADVEHFKGMWSMALGDYKAAENHFMSASNLYKLYGYKTDSYAEIINAAESMYYRGEKSAKSIALLAAKELFKDTANADACYDFCRAEDLGALAAYNNGDFFQAFSLALEDKALMEKKDLTNTSFYHRTKVVLALAAYKHIVDDYITYFDNAITDINYLSQLDRDLYFDYLITYCFNKDAEKKSVQERWAAANAFCDIVKQKLGATNPLYIRTTNMLFNVAENYEGFARILKDSIASNFKNCESIIAQNSNIDPYTLATFYGNEGYMYFIVYKDLDKSGEMYSKALNIIAENPSIESKRGIRLLYSNAVEYFDQAKKYDLVYKYGMKVKTLFEKADIPDVSVPYLGVLVALNSYYQSVGDPETGQRYVEMAINVRNKLRGNKENLSYLDNLLHSSNSDNKNKDSKKQNKKYSGLGPEIDALAEAVAHLQKGEYDEAEKGYRKCINLYREKGEKLLAVNNQGGLAIVYAVDKKYDMARKLIDSTIVEARTLRSMNDEDLADLYRYKFTIEEMITLYSFGREISVDRLYSCIPEEDSLVRNVIRYNFPSLTYDLRTKFWQKYSNFYLDEIPRMAIMALKGKDTRLFTCAYDAALLSKGLVLSSELETRKLINESGDTAVVRLFDEIQEERNSLNDIIKNNGDSKEIERLSSQIDEKEHRLMDESKALGDYTKRLTLTWEDVRNSLKKDEAAIEFTSFVQADTTFYYGLMVTPILKEPIMVSVAISSQLDQIPSDSLYVSSQLYNTVWKNFDNLHLNIKHIYFAPVGKLYSTAIEYAPMPDGKPFNTKYDIHRVSSTREVVLRDSTVHTGQSVLYGGLEYDADPQSIADANKTAGTTETGSAQRAVVFDRSLRGGVSYLEGTLNEVEAIGKQLKASGLPYNELTETNGTEESFKALSGKPIRLLHVATHGFYWTGDSTAHQNNPLENVFKSFLGSDATSEEDRMLTRSGLIFAGANTALRGEAIPQNMDDGILTAQELSTLDFHGLDLVVLSACESGLGQVNGDGVFGLQRGFKKAGARTLLMSLWKVDDRATQLLMTEFYRNLLSGKGKQESLTAAQQYLRSYEQNGRHPFDDPRYWAAFILLDADN